MNVRVWRAKVWLGITLLCLSACSWFGPTKHAGPDPSEIIVNGAPAGSVVFVDSIQAAPPAVAPDRPQSIRVRAGDHTVEIHVDDKIVYREDTYVERGETHAVTVLSGLSR